VSFEVRFLGITHLGHVLDCTGRVVARDEGARRVTVELATVNQYGERKIAGKAVVALP
jgi:acyl dehydratase